MSQPINPYAPPQLLDQSQQAAGGRVIVTRPYLSARGKTQFVAWASGIGIVMQAVLIGAFCLQLAMLYGLSGLDSLDPDVANANDLRVQVVSGFAILSMLVCLVALLVWIYSTHANLPALGARFLTFSSGWAVGWFFIPIANLFKPYYATTEIWQQSQPNLLLGRPLINHTWVGWWWGLRVVSGIAERALNSLTRNSDTLDSLVFISWVAIFLMLLIDIPMLTCQILLVRTVQRFQDERYELVSSQPPSLIPPGSNPFAA